MAGKEQKHLSANTIAFILTALCLISLNTDVKGEMMTISKILTEDAKPVIWRKQQGNITMNCTVLSGGPAPRITWMKHGKRIMASSKGHDWSALIISGLKESDAGKYRCIAEGKTRDVSMVHLHVEARPKIMFQRGFFSPTPRVVVTGQTVYLHCFASGEPKPSFQWLRNAKIVQDDPLHSSYALRYHTNGLDLIIDDISRVEAGMYTCRAENRIGTVLYKVEVVVNERLLPIPPEVKAVVPVVTATQGKNAILSCSGKYVPKGYSFVYWMAENQEINENAKYSVKSDFYTIRNVYTTKMMMNTSLTIRNVNLSDEGLYACVVDSPFGTGQRKLQLVAAEKGKPADVF